MLVTRPQGQNQALIEAIRKRGIEPVVLPTIEIQPIQNLDLDWEEIFRDVQLIIFISQNAACLLPKEAIDAISIPVITMGEATSRAARERGLKVGYTAPAGFTSEYLLEVILSCFQSESVVILKGEGGRDFLEKSLEKREKRVQAISLYRRVCPQYSDEELEQIFRSYLMGPSSAYSGEGLKRIILATSQENLSNLLKIIKGFSRFDLEKALSLKEWTVVVPSVRVQREALASDFEHVIVAVSIGSEDMLTSASFSDESVVTG